MKKLLILTLMIIALLVVVGCDRKITGDVQAVVDDSSESCLDCHSDGSGPNVAILAQYEESVHGSGNNTNRNRLYSSRYASCERCHTHEGFLAYVTGVPASGNHFSSFDCFTCHEPHTTGTFATRTSDPVTLENNDTYDRGRSNICAECHHSRRDVGEYVIDDVELSGRWGPHHSNQADMLIGTNAYEYSGYNYEMSWHATGVTNGCPSCHMSASVHETVGGHSFNMRNEERDLENITGCNVDGCHSADPVGSVDRETVSDFDGDGVVEGVQAEMHDLLDSLHHLLEVAGMVDAEGHPIEDRLVSTADSAGALYNFLFVEEDRSVGVHNTAYTVGLLKSSINFLNSGDPNGAPTFRPENSGTVTVRPAH